MSAPVCEFKAFEVWLTDAGGRSTDIGFKRKVNGPGASGAGMNVIYQVDPGKSVCCAMTLPLDSWIQPGKYTLIVKRWCLIFLHKGPGGDAISDARGRLVSNAIPIEVR